MKGWDGVLGESTTSVLCQGWRCGVLAERVKRLLRRCEESSSPLAAEYKMN